MAADLHIHVLVPPCTQEHVRRLLHTINATHDEWMEAYNIVSETPEVHVGEVSWLKAAIFEDSDTFIPDTVQGVADAIGEDFPVIDDALIEKIKAALRLPNRTDYSLGSDNEILSFLEEHRGKQAFMVSW